MICTLFWYRGNNSNSLAHEKKENQKSFPSPRRWERIQKPKINFESIISLAVSSEIDSRKRLLSGIFEQKNICLRKIRSNQTVYSRVTVANAFKFNSELNCKSICSSFKISKMKGKQETWRWQIWKKIYVEDLSLARLWHYLIHDPIEVPKTRAWNQKQQFSRLKSMRYVTQIKEKHICSRQSH